MSYPSVIGNSIQPYLDTLFAPGVLYNTIKSGIAVDYPIIDTGLSVYTPGEGEEASGSIQYDTNESVLYGDTFTVSDGGLNGGVGAVTFTFAVIAINFAASSVRIW